MYVEELNIDIYNFVGIFIWEDSDFLISESLSIENMLWVGIVVVLGIVVGVVFYIGREFWSVMNILNFWSKIGLFDLEVNCFIKIFFGVLVVVLLVMVVF